MHTLFYSDISQFSGKLQGMLDEGMCRTSIQNMHKLGWKAKYFNCDSVSILGHGFGVSKYLQFYDKIKNKYHMLPRPYGGSYLGEKGPKFFNKNVSFH